MRSRRGSRRIRGIIRLVWMPPSKKWSRKSMLTKETILIVAVSAGLRWRKT